MSDQCKHCQIRGDYAKCIKTECFHHENWINIQRINKIAELEKLLDLAWDAICEAGYEGCHEDLKKAME